MDPEQPLTRAEAQALLSYAEATYRSVTASQRRIAVVALALATVFGLLSLVSGSQWLQTRSSIDDVVDEPLVEGFGIQVPDPRPALERAQLRIQSLIWGVAAAASVALTLLFAAVYAIVRPIGGVRGSPNRT